jgi:hypothetical protein
VGNIEGLMDQKNEVITMLYIYFPCVFDKLTSLEAIKMHVLYTGCPVSQSLNKWVNIEVINSK